MNDLMNLLGDINEKAKPKVLDDGFLPYSNKGETDFIPDILPEQITLRGYQMAAVETILKFRRGILGFSPGIRLVQLCLYRGRMAKWGENFRDGSRYAD